MIKCLTKRLKACGGFTLAEMLMTVLILLMVSSIVAAGVPLATRAYRRVVASANAQILMSTAMTELKTELGSSREVLDQDTRSGSITYYSSVTGYTRIENRQNGIWFLPYLARDPDDELKFIEPVDAAGKALYSRPLIPAASKLDNLNIVFTKISYDEETKLFAVQGLKVVLKENGTNTTMAEYPGTLYVRTLNAK